MNIDSNYLEYLNESPTVFFKCIAEKNWPVEFVTKNVKKLFGYTDEEFTSREITFFECIHDDDKQRALQSLEQIEKSDQKSYEFEPYRIKTKNDEIVWVQDITNIIRNENHEVIYYYCYMTDISKEKKTNNELQEQKNLIQTIVDYIPSPIVLKDYEGKFILVNEATAKLYGSKPKEMIGKDDGDYIPDKEIADGFRENVRKIMDKGETEIVYEDSIDVNTNEVRNYMSIKRPLVNDKGEKSIFVLANDITDIQKAQKELKEKSTLLHEIIDGIPSPIILKDYNGKFILVNQATATLYDSTPDEMVGKDDTDYIPDKKMAKKFRHNVRDIMDKGETRIVYENSIDVKTNEIRDYMSIKKPLINDKGEKSILVLASDITELNKKNNELREKDKILLEQNKFASMGEMISNIAHQWRQPLSGISSVSSGMRLHKELDMLSDEDFFKSCDRISNYAQYLSKTIDDFRSFLNNDTVKVKFNLLDSFDKICTLVEGTIKNNEIKIIINIDRDINIEGYPNELIQCSMNIINNAKDALKDNENEKFIFINGYIKDEKIKIVFKDNGGGINENDLPHIFEPYYTTKHKSQGTGLGLSMTYSLIVEGMKGSINANNSKFTYNAQEYSGAEFIISLPID